MHPTTGPVISQNGRDGQNETDGGGDEGFRNRTREKRGSAFVAEDFDELEGFDHPNHGAEKSEKRSDAGDHTERLAFFFLIDHDARTDIRGGGLEEFEVGVAVVHAVADDVGGGGGMRIAGLADVIEFLLVEKRLHFLEKCARSELVRTEGDEAFEEKGDEGDRENPEDDHGDAALGHFLEPVDLNKLGAKGIFDEGLVDSGRCFGGAFLRIFGGRVGRRCLCFLRVQEDGEEEKWNDEERKS